MMKSIILTPDQLNSVKKNLMEATEGTNNLSKVSTKKLYKLSASVVKMLEDRLKDEYYAHFLYRAAANWCQEMNYKKAAAFFAADALTELEHAEKLQKYIADFNLIPEIPQANTNFRFDNLIDIINQAYDFELGLMKSYNQISHKVFQDDLTTFDFLQQFRDIQKESVVEFSDLINTSELVDRNDKFQVLYFEQTYF